MGEVTATISRYEMKYRIPSRLVAPIREVVQRVCKLDPKAVGPGRYRIASLYLDTPARRLYFETRNRMPRRFKLRVRRYTSGGKAFLEVKHRSKDSVYKTRVAIPIEAFPSALQDLRVVNQLGLEDSERRKVEDFVGRCLKLQVEPACVVRYEREPWVSTIEEYGRVTFDYRLSGALPVGWTLPIEDDDAHWRPCDAPHRYSLSESGVVLELKCTRAVPYWMTDLVRRFGLIRGGFSKYASVLESVGPIGTHAPIRRPSRRMGYGRTF